jgi:hypothetical protein
MTIRQRPTKTTAAPHTREEDAMHSYPDHEPDREFDDPAASTDPEAALRQEAVRRIRGRRNLAVGLVVYFAVNGMLVFFWARNGGGFFWPFFPIVFWGIGMLWQVFDVFGRGTREDKIQKEMRRLSDGRG